MKKKYLLILSLVLFAGMTACKEDKKEEVKPTTPEKIEDIKNDDWGKGDGFSKDELAFGEKEQTITAQRAKLDETGQELTKFFQYNQFNALHETINFFSEKAEQYDDSNVSSWFENCMDAITSTVSDDNKSGRLDEEYTILGKYKKILAASQFKGKFSVKSNKWTYEQAEDLSFTMPSGSGVGNTVIKLTTSGKEKTIHAYDNRDVWYTNYHYKLIKKVPGYKGDYIETDTCEFRFMYPSYFWPQIKKSGYYYMQYNYNTGEYEYKLIEAVDGLEKGEDGYVTDFYDESLNVYCQLLSVDEWTKDHGVTTPGYYYCVDEFESEETEYWITIPEVATLTITDGDKTLASLSIKSDISKIKGDKLDLGRDAFVSSVTLKVGDLEISSSGVEYSPSKIGGSCIIKSNDNVIVAYEASANLNGLEPNSGLSADDYNSALENTTNTFLDDKANITNLAYSLNILGKVQIKIACKDGQVLYKYFQEADDNKTNQAKYAECIAKANEAMDGGLYFYGGSVKQAEVFFEPATDEYWDYDEYEYKEYWYAQPVLRFSNGQTKSFEEYFDEDYFKDFISLVNDLEKTYEKKFND